MASIQAGNRAAAASRPITAGRRTAREGSMVVDAASGEVLGGTLSEVYVYEAPVRIWHWVMMVAMIVLAVTGYLIGSPWSGPSRQATFTYFFGNIRLIHFLAASSICGRLRRAAVLGHRRQPSRALDLRAAGVERQLVERNVPPGPVLRGS